MDKGMIFTKQKGDRFPKVDWDGVEIKPLEKTNTRMRDMIDKGESSKDCRAECDRLNKEMR